MPAPVARPRVSAADAGIIGGAAATPAPATPSAAHAGPLRDWLRRIRLAQWLHFLPLPLATFDPHAPLAAVRGVAIAFGVLAFGYLVNAVADRDVDVDARKNPYVGAAGGEHRLSIAGLAIGTVLLAATAPWPVVCATLVVLAFGWVYSVGPRIKTLPVVGSLANLGNFVPLLFVGMSGPAVPERFRFVVLAFAALLLQNQFIHEAADADEDRHGGVHTTWLAFGPRVTATLAAIAGLAASVAAGALASNGVAVAAMAPVFAVGFPLLLARRGSNGRQAARLRYTHRVAALVSGALLFGAYRLR